MSNLPPPANPRFPVKETSRGPAARGSARTRNASRNIVSQTGFTAVTMLVSFVSVPLLLRLLGRERFGASRVIADWFGYLSLLELGIGTSLLALLSRVTNEHDRTQEQRALTAGLRLYLKVVLAMVACGAMLAALMPELVRSVQVPRREVWLAGGLSLLGVLVLPSSLGRIYLSVQQRDYRTNAFLLLQSLLVTAFLIGFAALGWGLPGQVAGTFLGQLPIMIFWGWTLRRNFPGFWRQEADPAVTRMLWATNWPAFLFNLSGRVGLMSDNIVVATMLGPLAVAPFFLTQRVIVIMQGQLQGIGNSAWAGLMELHRRGEHAVFEVRTVELTGMISGLSFATLAPLGAFNAHFIARWINPSAYGGEAVTILACANGWMLAFYSLWGWLVVSGGALGQWLPYALAFTATNLLGSVAGTYFFGVPGPLAGTTFAFVTVQSWSIAKVLRAHFGLSPRRLYAAALQPAVWGGPFAVACAAMAHWQRTPPGWMSLFAQLALAECVGIGLWWTFSLRAEAREHWKRRLGTLLSAR